MRLLAIACCLAVAFAPFALLRGHELDDSVGPPNTQKGDPPTPDEAVAKFTVPDGFHVTLFAGEPNVQQPIALTTDARGRLWVAENFTYAEVPVGFETKLHDRIIILEDTNGDGRFDTRNVFWEATPIAGTPVRLTSVEVGFGGVWAICAPLMVFIPDENHDDVPDGPPQVLLDGFNDGAVRHNIVNGLKWGPDGWLYGRHGILANSLIGKPGSAPSQRVKLNCSIWRYHPTRHVFEVVAHGTTNSWGFDYNDHGEMFFINTVIGHLFHLLPGAHYKRMYGVDFNPHLYELIDQTADHFHFDTGEKWSDIRNGMSDTTSRAGGGHAHSGLMIYLGDNWPDRYRNDVFTVNFHGHRLNNDHLKRHDAGYVATHGQDMFFANNEWFRGIDLIYGPDGGAFLADWSDSGECHENDGVHRTSGRIYKLTYGTKTSVVSDDLAATSDIALVSLQLHHNDWFVRQSRRLLQERAAAGSDMSKARQALVEMFEQQADETRKLRAMWCLYCIGAADEEWLCRQLDHPNEHVRLWAVRLLTDTGVVNSRVAERLTKLAARESSSIARLYLACALQRVPAASVWPLASELVKHADDAADRAIPLMIWYGIEPVVPADPKQAIELARQTRIPLIRRHIARRLTSELETSPDAADQVVQALSAEADAKVQMDYLSGMSEALRGWRKAPVPRSWSATAAKLEKSSKEVQDAARQLGVVFGDGRAIDDLKKIVLDATADTESRRSALRTLIDDRSPELLSMLKQLIADAVMTNEVVRGFAAYDDRDVPGMLLGKYPNLDSAGQSAVIDTLTSRPSYARALLAAVEKGTVARTAITAFHARQIGALNDPSLTEQLTRVWGALRESSEDKKQLAAQLRTKLTAEVLASADQLAGRRVFEKSCATCHVLYGVGGKIGPDLTGSNRHNLNYLLENIVDPSASVGKQFQVSAIAMNDGRVVTGVVLAETERTFSVQTPKELLTINRSDVGEVVQQTASLMPDALLSQLTEAQIRDLFGYLSGRSQIELPEQAGQKQSSATHGAVNDPFVARALEPFWKTEQIQEPVLFIQRNGDSRPTARLLFQPKEIVLVTSGSTQAIFETGKDFTVDAASRTLQLTQDTRIPFLTEEKLFPLMTANVAKIGKQAGDKSRGIFFDNGSGYHLLQVEVTYRHAAGAWKGPVPEFAGNALPRTMKKLQNKEPIKLFLSGDSISEGYNASKFTTSPPGCPAYGELVARGLEAHFGSKVDFTNFAVAGWSAARGLQQVNEKRLGAQHPDVVIIAYGMNDVFQRDAATYKKIVREIMRQIRSESPETEFVLVATMLGNADWGMPMEEFPRYRNALKELCGEGVVLADLTAVWDEFLKHKSFYDLTGNGVNHPNDFGHIVYAQTILSLLVPPHDK